MLQGRRILTAAMVCGVLLVASAGTAVAVWHSSCTPGDVCIYRHGYPDTAPRAANDESDNWWGNNHWYDCVGTCPDLNDDASWAKGRSQIFSYSRLYFHADFSVLGACVLTGTEDRDFSNNVNGNFNDKGSSNGWGNNCNW